MNASRIIIELGSHSVLPMRDARGACVTCLDGALWITEEGNRNDFVLQQGEAHELTGDGEAVVQALGAARLALEFGDGALIPATQG